MKLNSNSLSSKLYRWFYGTNDLPNNFCPYFWKLLLAWITLIPYVLFCIPVIIYEMRDKYKGIYEYSDNSVGKRLGYSIGIYFLLFVGWCLLSVFSLLFTTVEEETFLEFCVILGTLFWFVFILIGSIELVKHIREKNKQRKIKYDENGRRIWEEPKPNLFVEFIKAKYNKHCPRIDWD